MINPYALAYLVAHIVPAMIGFGAMLLYTHLLSPAEYGIYVIGTSLSAVISAVFFTWLRQSVSRYQANSPEVDLRAEAMIAYCGTAVVVGCLTPVAIFAFRPDIGLGMAAAILLLSLSINAFEISQEFRRAQLNPIRFATIALLRSLLALTFGYSAIELGGGGISLVAAIGASFLITTLASYQGGSHKPLRLLSATQLGQFVRYGLPLSLGGFAFAVHSVLDRLSVGYLLGQSGAGYYGLAADMSRQLTMILAGSVASAMFPLAFRAFAQHGASAARERLKEGFELLLALILPLTVWLAICAGVLADALVGAEFRASVAMLLPLLAFGRMCGAINQFYLHVSFQLMEKPLRQVAHDTLTLLCNLAFLFPLTLAFGLAGTAAAVLIAEAAGILIGVLLSRGAFRLPFDGRGMARVVVSTVIMGLATYLAKLAVGAHGLLPLLTLTAVAGCAYAAAVLFFDVAGMRRWVISLRRPGYVPAE